MPTTFILAEADSGMTNLGTAVTQVFAWITEVLSTVSGNPLLLIGLGIFVAGAAIGLVYRLIHGG